jgi:hypothetical protein
MALGGFKKVAVAMRGGDFDKPDKAADWLRKCLSDDRRERLDPAQVMYILREARTVGFHAAMDYVASDAGYKAQPVDVQEQVQSLEEIIASGLQTLNGHMVNLTRLKGRIGQ